MATVPPLGAASTFAILAGTTVTNTGTSNINGDVGVSPGSAITGFPPGVISGGGLHADDALATQAEADLATAFGDLSAEPVSTILANSELGGKTLDSGVYDFNVAAATLNGTLTLDGQGDPNAVFIIRMGTTLTTGTDAAVDLINGAHAGNIFWQVGTSATIGTGTVFQGSILASTSITLNTSASIAPGRALAISGAVTMDTNASSSVFTTPLTITANNQTNVYGAAEPPLTVTYSGFINGDTSASLTTQPTVSTTGPDGSHVGNYSITASGAVDPDYTITYVAGTNTITQAPLTITANDRSKTYGALPTLTATYNGFVNGDTAANLTKLPTLTTNATAASPVSGNPYSITAAGAVDPDYAISYVPGTLTVTQAPLTITADDKSKTLGAALPTLTASYVGFVNNDTAASLTTPPTLTTTATASSSVAGSPYPITASNAVDSNYAISYAPGTLTVTSTQAHLIITANDQTNVYGAAQPALTVSYSGFINGDTAASLTTAPTLTTNGPTGSHVGVYSITASGAVDPNYTITYVVGTLTVTQAPLTITADDKSKTFGAALPTLTASYVGFVNNDTAASLTTLPTLSTTATASSSVAGSPYPITASGAVDPDYAISYAPGTLTVTSTQAHLIITATDQTNVYGAALPILTVSYSGFINGDTAASLTTPPTLATTEVAGSHVGAYSITASGAVDPNYTITYVVGTLTVTPAALTITADDQSKLYGAALPTLTTSDVGFVNGDTSANLTTAPTVTTTATAASHVSGNPYSIIASGAVDPDYAITYASGTLTVAPAPLIITADNQTKVVGAALPTLTASYSGLVNGDTSATFADAPNTPPSLATTATADSPVAGSPYAISASGALNPDYTIRYAAGTLTVTPTTTPPPTISGTVFLDLNASGSIDAADPGLAGRVVFLDLNHDGTLDAGDPTTTTDANGNFTFTGASSGTVVVEATSQDTSDRYVVDQTQTSANGTVTIGAVLSTPVAPVKVVPDPFSATPSTDANTAYVQALYHAVLGRTGADSEVDTWLVKMTAGMTSLEVANGFVNSLEHRQDQVNTYYEEFLHRAPDALSVNWVNELLSGVTEENVVEGFLDSPEYQAAHQDSTLFIHDLYLDVLGRQGEATGVAAWQAAVASGATRDAIVTRFVESPEADEQLVDSFYTAFLQRQREAVTSEPWITMLDQPNGAATAVAAGILASPEFDHDATTPQS
jgi:Ice-binding-like/MBG domain (YGX type)/Domain of unknown function (DUF4214)/SdrD B-like domain